MLEYPPSHLTPSSYCPRQISKIPLPTLSETIEEPAVLIEVVTRPSHEMEALIRAHERYSVEISLLERMHEDTFARSHAEELAELQRAEMLQREEAAKEDKKRLREEKKRERQEERRQREAGSTRGVGVWRRYAIVDEFAFRDKVNERHALVASGTRRGGKYKVDSDEDEDEDEDLLKAAREATHLKKKPRGRTTHVDRPTPDAPTPGTSEFGEPSGSSMPPPSRPETTTEAERPAVPIIDLANIESSDSESDEDIIYFGSKRAPSVVAMDATVKDEPSPVKSTMTEPIGPSSVAESSSTAAAAMRAQIASSSASKDAAILETTTRSRPSFSRRDSYSPDRVLPPKAAVSASSLEPQHEDNFIAGSSQTAHATKNDPQTATDVRRIPNHASPAHSSPEIQNQATATGASTHSGPSSLTRDYTPDKVPFKTVATSGQSKGLAKTVVPTTARPSMVSSSRQGARRSSTGVPMASPGHSGAVASPLAAASVDEDIARSSEKRRRGRPPGTGKLQRLARDRELANGKSGSAPDASPKGLSDEAVVDMMMTVEQSPSKRTTNSQTGLPNPNIASPSKSTNWETNSASRPEKRPLPKFIKKTPATVPSPSQQPSPAEQVTEQASTSQMSTSSSSSSVVPKNAKRPRNSRTQDLALQLYGSHDQSYRPGKSPSRPSQVSSGTSATSSKEQSTQSPVYGSQSLSSSKVTNSIDRQDPPSQQSSAKVASAAPDLPVASPTTPVILTSHSVKDSAPSANTAQVSPQTSGSSVAIDSPPTSLSEFVDRQRLQSLRAGGPQSAKGPSFSSLNASFAPDRLSLWRSTGLASAKTPSFSSSTLPRSLNPPPRAQETVNAETSSNTPLERQGTATKSTPIESGREAMLGREGPTWKASIDWLRLQRLAQTPTSASVTGPNLNSSTGQQGALTPRDQIVLALASPTNRALDKTTTDRSTAARNVPFSPQGPFANTYRANFGIHPTIAPSTTSVALRNPSTTAAAHAKALDRAASLAAASSSTVGVNSVSFTATRNLFTTVSGLNGLQRNRIAQSASSTPSNDSSAKAHNVSTAIRSVSTTNVTGADHGRPSSSASSSTVHESSKAAVPSALFGSMGARTSAPLPSSPSSSGPSASTKLPRGGISSTQHARGKLAAPLPTDTWRQSMSFRTFEKDRPGKPASFTPSPNPKESHAVSSPTASTTRSNSNSTRKAVAVETYRPAIPQDKSAFVLGQARGFGIEDVYDPSRKDQVSPFKTSIIDRRIETPETLRFPAGAKRPLRSGESTITRVDRYVPFPQTQGLASERFTGQAERLHDDPRSVSRKGGSARRRRSVSSESVQSLGSNPWVKDPERARRDNSLSKRSSIESYGESTIETVHSVRSTPERTGREGPAIDSADHSPPLFTPPESSRAGGASRLPTSDQREREVAQWVPNRLGVTADQFAQWGMKGLNFPRKEVRRIPGERRLATATPALRQPAQMTQSARSESLDVSASSEAAKKRKREMVSLPPVRQEFG